MQAPLETNSVLSGCILEKSAVRLSTCPSRAPKMDKTVTEFCVLATWFWLLMKEFNVDNGLWVGLLKCILEEIVSLDQQRLQPRNVF